MSLISTSDPNDPKAILPFDPRIGTRAYNFATIITRATGVAAADSAAIPAGVHEVLLHASKACYFRVQAASGIPAAAGAGIPMSDGEKFTLRVTPGQVVNAIRDTEDGTLAIIPVA